MKKLTEIEWFSWGMIAGYAIIFLFLSLQLALAGGGEFPNEQQQMVQKSIEVIVHEPEDDWKDYLAWLIPGAVVPIGLVWWQTKRHKKHGS